MHNQSALLSPHTMRRRHRVATQRALYLAADAQADLGSLAQALICLKRVTLELAAQSAPGLESWSAIDCWLQLAENHLTTAAQGSPPGHSQHLKGSD